MLINLDLIHRFDRSITAESVAIARELGAVAVPVGDGTAVITGPGFYVNRAFGLGLTAPVIGDLHLAELERVSEQAGVPAEIEASPWAHQSLFEAAAERGYTATATTSALAVALDRRELPVDDRTAFEFVAVGAADIDRWQDGAGRGFGYQSQDQRRVSDQWVLAASRVPEIELILALENDEVVAVSSLAIQDGVAMLGGMSTDPARRGRGAQQAMIRHRLATARAAGCDLAISTADPGSGSERNLLRAGFQVVCTLIALTRAHGAHRD